MPEHQNVKVYWPYNPYHASHNLNLSPEEINLMKKNKENLYEIPLKEYKFEYEKKPDQVWNDTTDTHKKLPGVKINEVPIDSVDSSISLNNDGNYCYKGHGSNRGYIIELPEEISEKIKNVTSYRIDVKMKLDVKYDKKNNREYVNFHKTFSTKEKSPFAIAGCSRLAWSDSENENYLPEIVDSPFYLQLSTKNTSNPGIESIDNTYQKVYWDYNDNKNKRSWVSPAPLEKPESSKMDKTTWNKFKDNNYSTWNLYQH